ncbi:IS110 family transposase [Mucilaginibacter gossypii]|uniref:IS110 family transposase n=1 Tax=Mucilaginibacter gossypii TaxID=551996 RepID=UPI001CB96A63|nr:MULTISPECIES: IS110 family transposase [Mucilaginibacter]QTE40597.2 IS110 family transposase [Mucilaginibacter gossypii]WMH62830.1 IS110 family transposase [Mucilaginibacter gossypii]WMH62850.1 IS110 family transposase [Mucilaginibacter gossypii]WMH62854.1 IS110 family transposase [Mucilaginibacter gossypii]WMH62868.1 IS110 family transposase [Mucilaginibacter gossypii]
MGKAKQNKKKKGAGTPAGSKKMERFGILYPRSAGIDVGSMLMVVSYTDSRDQIHLKQFDSFTSSLNKLADLLQGEKVEIVTMESTANYWMPLHSILESRGIKVVMINPSHYRNVSARKTDINDAQWLHKLLTHGLLRESHIAPACYQDLRQYIHERQICQDQKSDTLNRIQNTLTKMNIKFQHLISDIEGVCGMKLLRMICSGISDPEKLLCSIDHKRLKASQQELLHSLEGDYRDSQINTLRGSLKAYDFFKEQMLYYEQHIEQTLKLLAPEIKSSKKQGMVRKNQYHINLKDYLVAILGVDLTAVEGLDEIGLLTILAVTGPEMSKWPTAGHFTSWLNLSPRPKITGGKLVGYEKRITHNPATQAFRLAANCLWQSKGPLGQQYRKLAATKGKAKAIKAVARKIAVIFYNMVLKQEAYDVTKVQQDVEVQKARKISRLQKEAQKLGLTLQKAA